MKKAWVGILGALLVVLLLVWLFGGSRISCRESFWDKDTQVIEVKR